jgi:hypothetical protein
MKIPSKRLLAIFAAGAADMRQRRCALVRASGRRIVGGRCGFFAARGGPGSGRGRCPAFHRQGAPGRDR